MDTRELFARLIQCEAGGEGQAGMRAVATVIMNRTNIAYGEFARVSDGGNVRTPMRSITRSSTGHCPAVYSTAWTIRCFSIIHTAADARHISLPM